MDDIYVLIYIHTDVSNYTEVLGVYKNKSNAIDKLLEFANYREINGELTQYMESTSDYESMKVLRSIVEEKMELCDVDIYRIETHKLC
jgi:hypothetical protein